MPITITGAAVTGGALITVAGDPYFPYVPLLLNTTSTNAQTNNTFLDSSTNNFTITRNGTPTQGSLTPYWPNGQWSGYFNGSSYLTVPSNAALTFGTNSFTVEFWVFHTASGIAEQYLDGPTNAFSFAKNASNQIVISLAQISVLFTSTGTVPINQWSHIACVRNGTAVTIYINGVAGGTTTLSTNFSGSITYLFSQTTSTVYLSGYISNLRLDNVTAGYTSAFTPPTTPLTAITNTSLLTCQSNRFTDNSANNFTITPNGNPTVQTFQPFSPVASYTAATYGGSGYFNGTTDYLSVPTTTALQFGTGDFTFEFWMYLNSTVSNLAEIYQTADSNTTNLSHSIICNSTNLVLYLSSTGSSWNIASGTIITSNASLLNTWAHVALVRNGTTFTVYVNGVSKTTVTSALSLFSNTSNITFGHFSAGSNDYFPGYLSNVRIVKGTAVYTGNFTPPTLAPLTTSGSTSAASYSSTTNVDITFAAANTSLLLNFDNAGIYDAAMQNNPITVGSTQSSITQYQWSPTSMKFNWTTDYLDLGSNTAFVMGSGNWTVESWVYPTSTSPGHWIYLQGNASGYGAIRVGCQSNQVFLLISTNGSTFTVTSGLVGSVPINTWTYLAVTRSGSTITLYVNGTSVYTSTAISTSSLMTGTYNLVGRIDPTNLQYFAGYIQDLRITKGIARTITTPTSAFPTQ
jgi:hypothetical protein